MLSASADFSCALGTLGSIGCDHFTVTCVSIFTSVCFSSPASADSRGGSKCGVSRKSPGNGVRIAAETDPDRRRHDLVRLYRVRLYRQLP